MSYSTSHKNALPMLSPIQFIIVEIFLVIRSILRKKEVGVIPFPPPPPPPPPHTHTHPTYTHTNTHTHTHTYTHTQRNTYTQYSHILKFSLFENMLVP